MENEKNIEELKNGMLAIRSVTRREVAKGENLQHISLPGHEEFRRECVSGELEGEATTTISDATDHYIIEETDVIRAKPEMFLVLASSIRKKYLDTELKLWDDKMQAEFFQYKLDQYEKEHGDKAEGTDRHKILSDGVRQARHNVQEREKIMEQVRKEWEVFKPFVDKISAQRKAAAENGKVQANKELKGGPVVQQGDPEEDNQKE